ncbi:MAG: prepilin-type N-terminal cleavage/methylation domain-containing protein [Elusimicrobiaceae bacterium]|nr:prepilin-type N-terminal cleavage/methylation domain-containing protein [Elusimicrobiaceae bacterium]
MFIDKMKKGFNLIELMAVVLLVGLLVVPAAAQTKAQSKSEDKKVAEEFKQKEKEELKELKEEGKLKAVKGPVFSTRNFAVSIESVNKDNFVVIERIKGGKSLYAIYEDLSSGKRFCEDLDEKDNVKCESFKLDGKAYTCDDSGILSLDGKEGCKALETCKSCGSAGINKEINIPEDVKDKLEEVISIQGKDKKEELP